MPKRARAVLLPVAIAGVCFLVGLVSTLLWASFPASNSLAQQPSVIFRKASDAFSIVAEPLRISQELLSNSKTDQTSSLSREDLLIAIPSSLARLPLVQASRSWRHGARSIVVVESNASIEAVPQKFKGGMAAAREVFAVYPDLQEGPPAWHKPGDARAAMAPFLANQSSGADSYKWMLYGDDDTVFYLDNVLRMLEALELDPAMPYFITDHIWFLRSLDEELDDNRMHPARSAPRCLPCNYTDPLQAQPHSNNFEAPRGCPCTRECLCAHDNLKVFGGAEVCNVKQHNWYFGHGGAGAILSSGLMKLASFATVKSYVDAAMQGDPSTTVMSGDGVFSQVLFHVLGIMPTDPGYGYYRPHIQMFDPAWREDDTVGSLGKQPVAVMKRFDLALRGQCSAECEDLLQHLMTVHLGSRDAADDINFADMLPAMQSAAGNDHMSAAAFMHQRFATLFEQYSSARGTLHARTPWFAVALPHQ
ncbi:hypothetical protein ABBQ38_008893 [Trebouxia sp. C0009 RCD-2024]